LKAAKVYIYMPYDTKTKDYLDKKQNKPSLLPLFVLIHFIKEYYIKIILKFLCKIKLYKKTQANIVFKNWVWENKRGCT
jgi:hypothetical protein